MKTIITTLIGVLLFISAKAQFTGKPIYNIRVERSDTFVGDIVVEMFPEIAPNHVLNWDSLVVNNLFDSTAFHRIISGFMIQGGDPNSVNGPTSTWGQGNSSQVTVDAEFSEVPHARGILSAARSTNINSASSQFFICHANSFSLDGNYTVYGQTISGIDMVDLIVLAPKNSNDLPNDKISMIITKIGSNDSVPIAPTLNTPANMVKGVYPSTSFSWSAIGDAKLYKFEIATDSTFNNIVYTHDSKSTSVHVNSLSSVVQYYWRVRANNGGHLSSTDEIRRFTSGVEETELISPSFLEETENDLLFIWKDVPQSSGYHIMVSQAANFFNPIYTVLDTIVQLNEFWLSNALELSTVYYWKVATVDAEGGESAFTISSPFKPTTVYDGLNDLKNKSIMISPNPFDNEILIESEIDCGMKIYSVLGELILNHKITKGSNIVEAEGLKSGTYIYEIGNKRGKIIKK